VFLKITTIHQKEECTHYVLKTISEVMVQELLSVGHVIVSQIECEQPDIEFKPTPIRFVDSRQFKYWHSILNG
jgi:hypothetical protein